MPTWKFTFKIYKSVTSLATGHEVVHCYAVNSSARQEIFQLYGVRRRQKCVQELF